MKLKTSLLVIILALSLGGCDLFNRSESGNGSTENPSEETPPPAQSNLQTDRIEGELCIFERVLPNEIVINEPFIVTVNVEAIVEVQSAFIQEDGWFREFRKDREPIQLWQFMQPGERRVYTYEVTMWSRQAESHPFTTGTVSCNSGGLGLSEVLELRSDLNLVFE